MAGKHVVQVLEPQRLISSCIQPRKVRLPAHTFQLLARSTNSQRDQSLRGHQPRWLHTASKRREQQHTEHRANDNTKHALDLKDESTAQGHQEASSHNVHNEQLASEISSVQSTDPVEKHEFREYMRKVTHPVAIITSTDTSIDAEGGPNSWRGATVSSFNSVTLYPEPYVSFNIKKRSSTYDAIRHSQFFAVHVMSNTPEALAIATHFSTGRLEEPFFNTPPAASFDGQEAPRSTTDAPLHTFVHQTKYDRKGPTINGPLPPTIHWQAHGSPRAVLFQSLCKFQPDQIAEVGDHVIVVGRVIRTVGNLDEITETRRHATTITRTCLTYVNGQYSNEHGHLSAVRVGGWGEGNKHDAKNWTAADTELTCNAGQGRERSVRRTASPE